MLFKHNLDMEKLKAKDGPDVIDVENVTTKEWNQEQITKMLDGYM